MTVVFAAIVGLQLAVAALSIDLLSSVRAYVAGESLYSKGQKDAYIALIDYVERQRDDDHRRFVRALEVPLGDGEARVALQRPVPDRAAARRGLLAGGNHEDDIDGMIRLFLWFHRLPLMAGPIASWTEGDEVVQQLRSLGEQAHAHIAGGQARREVLDGIRAHASTLNERLGTLSRRFSAQLGAASRETQMLLLGVNGALAALLGVTGFGFVRRSAQAQARTEGTLRQREESLQRLLDSAAEGLYGVDVRGRCTFINRAALAMLGYAQESELLGRDVHALIHHTRSDGSAHPVGDSRIFEAFRHGKRVHLADEVFWRRDGSSLPVECWSHPVSRHGATEGAVVTFVDISERVRMQAALRAGEVHEAASRAKSDFLSRMSHELRTPLNAVLGFAQLLRQDRREPPTAEQRRRLEHIETAGLHLLALVDDVLDLSGVEAGHVVVQREPVHLEATVSEAIAMVAALATRQAVALVDDGDAAPPAPDGGPWVEGDAQRLRQVLVNLLTNAIKYNRSGGRVVLSHRVDDDGGTCTLRIADTGYGIAADKLARLFEPFNRLGAERTRVQGRGIGLVLSRRLAEAMGGTLTVASEPDRGTTATLTLRRSAAPPARTEAPAAPGTESAAPGARLDILYAEDDPVNAELVRHIFALRPNVALRIAESGAAALAAARARAPDLMLVDMNLGDMTGRQLVDTLRHEAALAQVRYVALSADALPAQIESALAAGFERYLTKPVDFRQLLALVEREAA